MCRYPDIYDASPFYKSNSPRSFFHDTLHFRLNHSVRVLQKIRNRNSCFCSSIFLLVFVLNCHKTFIFFHNYKQKSSSFLAKLRDAFSFFCDLARFAFSWYEVTNLMYKKRVYRSWLIDEVNLSWFEKVEDHSMVHTLERIYKFRLGFTRHQLWLIETLLLRLLKGTRWKKTSRKHRK